MVNFENGLLLQSLAKNLECLSPSPNLQEILNPNLALICSPLCNI
jgi:hypothetical protein